MNEELSRLLADISAYSVFLPLLIGLLRLRKLVQVQQLLLGLLFISCCFEFGAFWVSQQLDSPNLPLLHVFTVLQFCLLLLIFRQELIPLIPVRWFPIILVSFVVFAVIDASLISGLQSFNPLARLVESILLLFFSLAYLYKTLNEMRVERLEREPSFWISSGLLIYFAGGFLIFISSNYLMPLEMTAFLFWGLHAVLNTILNLFYSAALWTHPQQH